MEFFSFMYNIINIEAHVTLTNRKCVHEEMNKSERNSYFKNDLWLELIFGEDACAENSSRPHPIKILSSASLTRETS